MQLIILIIAVILFVLYASLIIYYSISWMSLPESGSPSTSNEYNSFISVIIPARNESANIKNCLDAVTKQQYPAHLYEVIVIDDHSTDDTVSIVRSFAAKNVKLILLKDHIAAENINAYKKKAIEIAVKESKGTLIVTTDADCTMSNQWLISIASLYEKKQPAFIAAPVAINCNLSFIEIFQSLDFMTLQGITGAAVYRKKHSMCNGANLAYEKNAFNAVEGFNGIDNIASGDDMLLMHKISKQFPGKISFLKSRDAIVQTAPQKTVSAFFNQRVRWASKADKYDDKSIFPVLLIVYLFNLVLLAIPVICLFSNPSFNLYNNECSLLEAWLLLIILKTMTELFFLFPVAGFFNKRSLLWFFPLMQPFHILYTVIAGFLGKFGTYKWKERKVK